MIQTLLPFNAVAAVTAAARAAAMSFVAPGPAASAPSPAAAAAESLAERRNDPGFALGWDHARHGLTPPLDQLPVGSPLRQGWLAARALFGQRTLPAGATVRQWLALRLQAWAQGQAFETVQVTPNFIAQIAARQCPVSRQPLRLRDIPATDATATATATASDGPAPGGGTVFRLNPGAAYAAGNLATIDRGVAEACGTMDFDAVWSQAQRIAAGECSTVRDLDGATWLRLAVLMSFATPLAHARAACLPLAVLPPNRVRVINPVQALQVMLTLQFTQGGYARRLLELSALMPGTEARQAFQIFMHTLLARRLAAGPGATAPEVRQALEDSWADPLVNRRWQRLALRLSAADCERLLQRAAQRDLLIGGSRWLSDSATTEGWALPDAAPQRGRAQLAEAQALSGSGMCSARPGSARNRGSQKLAS